MDWRLFYIKRKYIPFFQRICESVTISVVAVVRIVPHTIIFEPLRYLDAVKYQDDIKAKKRKSRIIHRKECKRCKCDISFESLILYSERIRLNLTSLMWLIIMQFSNCYYIN